MPENSNHTRVYGIVPEQPAQEDPDAVYFFHVTGYATIREKYLSILLALQAARSVERGKSEGAPV